MNDAFDPWKQALAIYQRDVAGWTILWGAALGLAVLTFGIGSILIPNCFRATRDALREDRSPDLGALFRFDDIMEDAIAVGGYVIVSMVASSVLGPLSVATSFVLGFAPVLVTEEQVGGLDALQGSVAALQRDPGPVFVFWLISIAINTPLACCLIPLFVTMPISGIATWLFYDAHRERMLMLDGTSP